MTGKVVDLLDVIQPDQLATRISEKWVSWDNMRAQKKRDWEEIIRYVYATDTSQTTNAQNPWKNKTTVPKACQIADNLYANYTATLFPKRKWMVWEGDEVASATAQKSKCIVNYMRWVVSQPSFKHEMDKALLDFIYRGNAIGTVEWVDQRVQLKDKVQAGYVGPAIRRLNPLDVVINPTAENFQETPKIVKSIISTGELKSMLERMSNDDNREDYETLYKYLREIRSNAANYTGDWTQRDNLYAMDGFTSFREYLMSDTVEILTFYGDFYDKHNDHLERNQVITVVDRHKLIGHRPNPSYFGYPPIYHVPWRKKQDNLWGMGPLDNLIGIQYRIDHLENMAADVWDLSTYPVQMVKGYVEDFVWQPGEKIFVSEEGDVKLVTPDVNLLQADMKIEKYWASMEELAGAPREAMGIRSPGEKTALEVRTLENASARIFQNKIKQFEEQFVEPLLNAMLELARRNLTGSSVIKVFDDEFDVATFQELTVEDITGIGRIKPVAARHFAEQSELVQNLTALTNSGLWPTVQLHLSGVKLAKVISSVFNLDDYEVNIPFVALAEQAEGQKQAQALQEQVQMAQSTATGMGMDYDMHPAQQQAIEQQTMQQIAATQ